MTETEAATVAAYRLLRAHPALAGVAIERDDLPEAPAPAYGANPSPNLPAVVIQVAGMDDVLTGVDRSASEVDLLVFALSEGPDYRDDLAGGIDAALSGAHEGDISGFDVRFWRLRPHRLAQREGAESFRQAGGLYRAVVRQMGE